MCLFYCWECSPRDVNDPKDNYYRMSLCCISKNILTSIIWLFAIRFLFDLAFTIIFAIFEVYLFFIATLIVGILLVLSIAAQRLKLLWLYYVFGCLTVLLLLADSFMFGYVVYSIVVGDGSLYNYSNKHISEKSHESLFTANKRSYTATDIILLIFSIFLLISFLHDLTNLLMTYRSIRFLKRFPKVYKNNQNVSTRLTNLRSNTNVPTDHYEKRNSNFSIPSSIAPGPPHISVLSRSSPDSNFNSVFIPQPIVNDGYRPCPGDVTTVQTNHNINEHYVTPSTTAPIVERITYPEDDRIRPPDAVNAFAPDDKKKKEELKYLPPLPPKNLNSPRDSEAISGIHENMTNQQKASIEHSNSASYSSSYAIPNPPQTYNQPQNVSSIAFSGHNRLPSTTANENEPINSISKSVISSPIDDDWRTPLSSPQKDQWKDKDYKFTDKITQNQTNQNYDKPVSSEIDNIYNNFEHKQKTQRDENYVNVEEKERVRSDSEMIAIYSLQKMEEEEAKEQQQDPTLPLSEYENIPSRPSTLEMHREGNRKMYENYLFEKQPIESRYVNTIITPQSQQPYEPLSYDSFVPIPTTTADFDDNFSEVSTVHEKDEEVTQREERNDETLSFASCNSEDDVVEFWSHHRSTRRGRRLSRDLLNNQGFLTDSSENEEAAPKLPENNPPALKNFGLTQMLQMEGKAMDLPNTETTTTNPISSEVKMRDVEIQRPQYFNNHDDNFHIKSLKNLEGHDEVESASQLRELNTFEALHDKSLQKTTSQNNQAQDSYVNSYHYEIPPLEKQNQHSFTQFTNEPSSSQSAANFKVTKESNPIITTETPVIPYPRNNFFESWGSATDKLEAKEILNKENTTIKRESFPNETINNMAMDSDSDSIISFSSSDGEGLDDEAKCAALKQKLLAHLNKRGKEEKQHKHNNQRSHLPIEGKNNSFINEEVKPSSSRVTYFPVNNIENEIQESAVSFDNSQWSQTSSITYHTQPTIQIFHTSTTSQNATHHYQQPTIHQKVAQQASASSSSCESLSSAD